MAKILIVIGFFFLIISALLVRQRYSPVALQIRSYKMNKAVYTIKPISKPSSLEIVNLNIHLPVIPSTITDGQWETTPDGVSYLTTSPIPGDIGNSILYGHNWPSLLGRLPQIKPGNTIHIHYTDGSIKTFKVSTTAIVRPDQISILDQTKDKRITLYTCTGFLDSQRFVVVALLKD